MNQKTKDEIVGKKATTLAEVKANLNAKITALDKIATNSIKLSERKAARLHADQLRSVLAEIV